MFSVPSNHDDICNALNAAGLADRVFLPTDTDYSSSLGSYYAGNVQELHSWCIVKPETTYEVSKALSALVKTSPAGNWDIAIRGGEHSHFDSNNVAQGVTIDLSRMNATTYRNGSSIASIQSGAGRPSVFAGVEKYGQTVTRGRAGSVGVSGLTLGGGASVHTGNRGFACDDIQNYEVVLPDGFIINATAYEHPDLFTALKGGSNNFLIVTRFGMVPFKAAPGGIWGGEGLISIAINAVNTAGIFKSTSFSSVQGLPSILNALKRRSYGNIITEYEFEGGERNV
ncbi:FAD binding domain-containing protein [Colletotrichum fioriniae PJ7]|uniref:FAD binding domain-containing protein n=1 Tax=Colletotrichum fioriniae PJ7 TaxID=1445577 RepID=A0A010R7C7_9PEZI|nr:FAD binding domain-containing protein [Colletotrichum fioriniae PJ7]